MLWPKILLTHSNAIPCNFQLSPIPHVQISASNVGHIILAILWIVRRDKSTAPVGIKEPLIGEIIGEENL